MQNLLPLYYIEYKKKEYFLNFAMFNEIFNYCDLVVKYVWVLLFTVLKVKQ